MQSGSFCPVPFAKNVFYKSQIYPHRMVNIDGLEMGMSFTKPRMQISAIFFQSGYYGYQTKALETKPPQNAPRDKCPLDKSPWRQTPLGQKPLETKAPQDKSPLDKIPSRQKPPGQKPLGTKLKLRKRYIVMTSYDKQLLWDFEW